MLNCVTRIFSRKDESLKYLAILSYLLRPSLQVGIKVHAIRLLNRAKASHRRQAGPLVSHPSLEIRKLFTQPPALMIALQVVINRFRRAVRYPLLRSPG